MTHLPAVTFTDPAILLGGDVDYDMYWKFRDQMAAAPASGVVVVELSTLGGDPEVARMMGEDIRFQDGLDTQINDGDEVTILPAVAGG